jgi:hypothetical protein
MSSDFNYWPTLGRDTGRDFTKQLALHNSRYVKLYIIPIITPAYNRKPFSFWQ